MTKDEMLAEDILAFELETLQLHVDHVFQLVCFEVPKDVGAILETSKEILAQLRKIFSDDRSTSATLVASGVIDPTNKLLAVFIRRQNISGKYIAIRTDKQDLTSSSFFKDSPFPDNSMRFLSSNSQDLPASITQHSNLFINTNKDTHFGQFDLIDIKIADIVAIVSSCYMSFIVYVHETQVM